MGLRIAILEPTTLVARELRDQLELDPGLWSELDLVSLRADVVGTLTEVGGAAAMVTELTPSGLQECDVLFLCDPTEEELSILAQLPDGAAAILVGADGIDHRAKPIVAGYNSDGLRPDEVLSSPDPTVVGLTHILAPLRRLGLSASISTVLQPVSVFDQGAFEELFAQTRALLEFRKPPDGEFLHHQVAFNLFPAPDRDARIVDRLVGILGDKVAIGVQTIQASVYHGLSLNIHCQVAPATTESELVAALEASPHVRFSEEPDTLGPIDVASQECVLIGRVRAAHRQPGAFWLWAVMDNLARGSALNALEIARTMRGLR